MIPRRLKIRGFLSYSEPADIDFSDIRVACISGENGSGKSSLLDAMTWALFGKARSTDYSLINSSSGNNLAEVIFEFEYESEVYRIIRVLERGKTGRVDFFVWSEETEEWRILTENTLTGTNKQIARTLHLDYDTFINVSFFLQGKADLFTNQSPANRKKILSNILELEVWDRYKEIAAERSKNESIVLHAFELRDGDIKNELNEELPRRLEMEKAKADFDATNEAFQLKNKALTEARLLQERLKGQLEGLQNQKKTFENRQTDLRTFQTQKKEYLTEAEKIKGLLSKETEVMQQYQAYLDVKKVNEELAQRALQFNKLEREKTSLESEIQKMTSRLEADRDSLQRELKQIEQFSERYEERSRDLVLITERQQALEKNIAQKEAISIRMNASLQASSRLSGNREAFRMRLKEIQHKIEDLSAADVGTPCPFCGRELDAVHSEQYLAQLEQEKTGLTQSLQEADTSLAGELAEQSRLEKQLTGIADDEKAFHQTVKQAESLRSYIEQVEAGKEREAEVRAQLLKNQSALDEQSYGAEVRKRISELDVALISLDYDPRFHAENSRKEKELSTAETQRNELIQAKATLEQLEISMANLNANISAAEQEVAELGEQVEVAKRRYLEESQGLPDVNGLQAELLETSKQLDRVRSVHNSAVQRYEVLDTLRKEKKELQNKISGSKQLISQWRTLEQAFSKNGIPALLIEAALPEIEEHANLMLGRLTDGRMSVNIRTQAPLKTREDLKETLEILINDENGTRPYEMFSGGEMFRVNFAIRLALANMLAKRSGARMQLLVIDEGFGSQDAEGRQRLIEAITEVQNDYEMILVITHLEELKDAFPQRIEVEKGENGSMVTVFA